MKKTGLIILALIVLVLILITVFVWGSYNKLIVGKESVSNAWSQVETQYQRRFDLIPNLVESVRGAMKQEETIFTALAEARTRYAGASTQNEKALAAGQVESAFARLLVVMENYPTLKSSEQVATLMSQIEGTENRVSVERGRYNENVRVYNLLTKKFPSSLVAGLFGFEASSYFEADSGASSAPKVQF